MRRRGFTFVELLTVILVLSILASVAVAKYLDLKHRALAANAAEDMHSVRYAAYSAAHTNGEWPAETGAGAVPPEMKPHLGEGVVFSRPDYTLDWENLGTGGGGIQIGVTVTAKNDRLRHALVQLIGNKGPFLAVGNQVTLIIVGPDGES